MIVLASLCEDCQAKFDCPCRRQGQASRSEDCQTKHDCPCRRQGQASLRKDCQAKLNFFFSLKKKKYCVFYLNQYYKERRSMSHCSYCSFFSNNLSTCGSCRKVYYCNTTCQTKDWKKIHFKICDKLSDTQYNKVKKGRIVLFGYLVLGGAIRSIYHPLRAGHPEYNFSIPVFIIEDLNKVGEDERWDNYIEANIIPTTKYRIYVSKYDFNNITKPNSSGIGSEVITSSNDRIIGYIKNEFKWSPILTTKVYSSPDVPVDYWNIRPLFTEEGRKKEKMVKREKEQETYKPPNWRSVDPRMMDVQTLSSSVHPKEKEKEEEEEEKIFQDYEEPEEEEEEEEEEEQFQ
jgi:hypothetical protein